MWVKGSLNDKTSSWLTQKRQWRSENQPLSVLFWEKRIGSDVQQSQKIQLCLIQVIQAPSSDACKRACLLNEELIKKERDLLELRIMEITVLR